MAAPPMASLAFPVTAGIPPVLVEVEAVLAAEVDPEPEPEPEAEAEGVVRAAVVGAGEGVIFTVWIMGNGGRIVVANGCGRVTELVKAQNSAVHSALALLPEP